VTRNLYFLDIETTGLDIAHDFVLEVAVVKTTLEAPFEEVGEPFCRVMPYGSIKSLRACAFPVVRDMHDASGLWEDCRRAHAERTHTVGQVIHELIDLFADERGKPREERPVLAGSTVHFDRAFVRRHLFSEIDDVFSHRHYDVSSVKLFCQSLGMPQIPKGEAHRALADVRESIAHARMCAEWLGRGRRTPCLLVPKVDPECAGYGQVDASTPDPLLALATIVPQEPKRPALRKRAPGSLADLAMARKLCQGCTRDQPTTRSREVRNPGYQVFLCDECFRRLS
jgi:oligoribonuclease